MSKVPRSVQLAVGYGVRPGLAEVTGARERGEGEGRGVTVALLPSEITASLNH